MFDGNFRPEVEAKLRPVGHQIKKSGITADHLTTLGLVIALGAATAIALGSFKLAFLLVVLTGIPDLLDGAVAKASGTAGPRGAFFDSVIDRVTDALLFGAVAVYYSRENPGLVWLPVLVMASASWVSYLRAKAEALGFDARGGLIERAERFILFCLGLLFPFILAWVRRHGGAQPRDLCPALRQSVASSIEYAAGKVSCQDASSFPASRHHDLRTLGRPCRGASPSRRNPASLVALGLLR